MESPVRSSGILLLVQLLAERHLVELLQDRLVEAHADPVRLRALHFRLRVINIVDRQEELMGMLVQTTAVLGPRSVKILSIRPPFASKNGSTRPNWESGGR